MTKKATIVIAEGCATGHRLNYVRLIAEAARAQGNAVVLLVSSNVRNSSEWGLFLSGLDGIDYVEAAHLDLEVLRRVAREKGADVTVIPDSDAWLPGILRQRGWRGPGTLSLLVMRASAQMDGRSYLEMVIGTALKRGLMLMVSMTPGVRLHVLRSPVWRGWSFFRAVPDPVTLTVVPSAQDAAAALGLESSRTWFAVLGVISNRKNVPLVAEALAEVSDCRVGLVVAGKCDPEQLRAAARAFRRIKAGGGEVLILDRLLEETELDSIVQAVHCVVLAHSNEGPSGLLGKAAAAGTFVLAAGPQSLKRDARHVPQLATWVELSAPGVGRAAREIIQKKKPEPAVACGADGFTDALL